MGQYWRAVNLDRKEFLDPYKLGTGAKLWEQLANSPGVGAALIVLGAAMPENRGGGDFDLEENWHGPEREQAMADNVIAGMTPGQFTEDYQETAKRTIGRWAGGRIALVGDYAEDTDLPLEFSAAGIYDKCASGEYLDITQDVSRVIEHELNGKFEGDDYKKWTK